MEPLSLLAMIRAFALSKRKRVPAHVVGVAYFFDDNLHLTLFQILIISKRLSSQNLPSGFTFLP